ncbi:MAG: acyl-homoserine-lactone synthase [Pseudomonadota bacterium]
MNFTLVYGQNLHDFAALGDQMLRDRGAQFKEALGWDLYTDQQGRELDEYDALNPLYLILSDDDGDHVASTRLMPTTGRNMAAEHFSHLTDDVAIESPAIWETTRFFVAQKSARRAAPALMWAGCQLALRSGVDFYLGVIGAHMARVFTACGWAPEIVGRAGQGEQEILACLWEVNPEICERLRRRAGVRHGEHDLRIHRPVRGRRPLEAAMLPLAA